MLYCLLRWLDFLIPKALCLNKYNFYTRWKKKVRKSKTFWENIFLGTQKWTEISGLRAYQGERDLQVEVRGGNFIFWLPPYRGSTNSISNRVKPDWSWLANQCVLLGTRVFIILWWRFSRLKWVLQKIVYFYLSTK